MGFTKAVMVNLKLSGYKFALTWSASQTQMLTDLPSARTTDYIHRIVGSFSQLWIKPEGTYFLL